jgi:VanZ family protein
MDGTRSFIEVGVEKALRSGSYASVVLIGVLSLIPGTLRPDTGAPGKLEHLVAYMGAAALVALGSRTPSERWQGLWLVPLAGALEIAQIFVPGRHSRFSDFVVSGVGALLGVIVAFGVAPLLRQQLTSQPNARGERV